MFLNVGYFKVIWCCTELIAELIMAKMVTYLNKELYFWEAYIISQLDISEASRNFNTLLLNMSREYERDIRSQEILASGAEAIAFAILGKWDASGNEEVLWDGVCNQAV